MKHIEYRDIANKERQHARAAGSKCSLSNVHSKQWGGRFRMFVLLAEATKSNAMRGAKFAGRGGGASKDLAVSLSAAVHFGRPHPKDL